MQRVGHAHQQQLQILEKHWDLLQDFEKGKLDVFRKEHELLRQKQRHLLHEALVPNWMNRCVAPGGAPASPALPASSRADLPRRTASGAAAGRWPAEPPAAPPAALAPARRLRGGPGGGAAAVPTAGGAAPGGSAGGPKRCQVTEAGVASLRAEQAVLGTGAAVLRVPRWVYGAAELGESPVTGILEELRRGKVDFDIQPVYPTYAGDVASVVHLLVEHLLKGGELRGIYHFQGPDQLSELQIAKLWCQAASALARGWLHREAAQEKPAQP
eukprot:Skav205986  [mRNA]  locus=scaffold442:1058852:1066046:- [translate_table: standard]